MARNLSDAWSWIDKIVRRLSRLESGAMLENSSITNGRLRLIGGLLLLDSGATLRIIGTVDGQGDFQWTGPWSFNSPEGGSIAGNVDLAGDFDLTGKLTADGIRIENGKIYVGAGSSAIVIDGATGKVTAGNVVIEQNKITVGGGASPATMRDGGVSFETGGKLEADASVNGVRMVAGDAVMNAGNTASMRKGNVSVIAGPLGVDVNAAALRLLINAPITLTAALIPTQAGTGLPAGTLLITSGGALRRAA